MEEERIEGAWQSLELMPLPSQWSQVRNSASSFSVVRTENWKMNGTRMVTEIIITKEHDADYRIQLSTQGSLIRNVLTTDIGIKIAGLPFKEQLQPLVTFLDSPTTGLCSGFPFDGNVVMHTSHRTVEISHQRRSCVLTTLHYFFVTWAVLRRLQEIEKSTT